MAIASLHAFPPLSPDAPFPAFGYLRGYVARHRPDIRVETHYWNQEIERQVIDPRAQGWTAEQWTAICSSAFTVLALHGNSECPSSDSVKHVYDIQYNLQEALDFDSFQVLVTRLVALIERGLEKRQVAGHSIVACSLEFLQEIPSLAFLKLVKRRYPAVTTVVGGRYDAALAESVIECCPFVDICVFDEGQRAFLSLCEQMPVFDRLDKVPGIVHRDGHVHCVTEASAPEADLEDDFADYGGFDWGAVNLERSGSHTLGVWDSRDCWWGRCTFCTRSGVDVPARYRSAGSIMSEVRELLHVYPDLAKNNLNIFLLGPDSIGRVPERFTDILRGLVQLRGNVHGLSVTAIVSPSKLDSEMVSLMDCLHGRLIMGFERWDSMLATMNKPHRVEHGIRAVKLLVRYPNVSFNFPILIGHPGETLAEIQEMVDNLWRMRFLLQGKSFSFNVTPIETYRNSVLGRVRNFDAPEILALYESAPVALLLASLGGDLKAATALAAHRYPMPNQDETGTLDEAARMLREVETHIDAAKFQLTVAKNGNDVLVLQMRENSVTRELEFPAHLTARLLDETEWIVSERLLRSHFGADDWVSIQWIVQALEESGLLYQDHKRHVMINALPLGVQGQIRDVVAS